jgi:hypothetical protein
VERPSAERRSRDNIGKQPVLDLRNAILQDKLLLFQPLDQKLVSGRVIFKGGDFAVELSVLGSQSHQLFPELAFVAPLHFDSLPAAQSIAAFWVIALDLATGQKRDPERTM